MPESPRSRLRDRYWAELPWAAKSLESSTREASLAALRSIASQLFSIAWGLKSGHVPASIEAFMARAEHSPALASVLEERAVLNVGTLLDDIAYAKAIALRAEWRAELMQQRPRLRQLQRLIADLERLGTKISAAGLADMRRTMERELLAPLKREAGALAILDKGLSPPARRPKGKSPEFWIAQGVDKHLGFEARRAERDDLAAALCREVLGLDATASGIERMMKPYRRKRSSPKADT